jgi:hypothetical protein
MFKLMENGAYYISISPMMNLGQEARINKLQRFGTRVVHRKGEFSDCAFMF